MIAIGPVIIPIPINTGRGGSPSNLPAWALIIMGLVFVGMFAYFVWEGFKWGMFNKGDRLGAAFVLSLPLLYAGLYLSCAVWKLNQKEEKKETAVVVVPDRPKPAPVVIIEKPTSPAPVVYKTKSYTKWNERTGRMEVVNEVER